MIDISEMIKEYEAQGYSCKEAIQLAKADFKEKKAVNRKNNLEATNKRICASRSFLALA